MKKIYKLRELATIINGKIIGDPECEIFGVNSLDLAGKGEISFIVSDKYKSDLMKTNASAIILSEKYIEYVNCPVILSSNPHYDFSVIAGLFVTEKIAPHGIHCSAVVGSNCDIHSSVSIGPNSVIGDHVYIEAGTKIAPGCIIDDYCKIGSHCKIYPNVTIYYGVSLGDRCVIHSGAVIGSDGFGWANKDGKWFKVPQIGSVVVGNDVDIGANTTIDRGSIKNTVICDGVKIDNLVQIGHNCEIGNDTIIAGCTGIAGSVKIGKKCILGGGVGVADHVTITDSVIITATTGVSHSIPEPGVYSSGGGIQPNNEWRKNVVRFKQLDKIVRRVMAIESKLNVNGGNYD